MEFVFLFLTYFTYNLLLHLCCCKWQYFVLSCGWIVFYLMYVHIFIDSSVHRLSDCFHVLAAVNSGAINIGVHVSFWIIVLSRCMPRSGIAGSTLILFLVFWGTSILFSIMSMPTYIPDRAGSFPFLYTLFSICYLYTF